MSNDTMLNDAEFENEIREMSDRQLSEFTARQVLGLCKRIKGNEGRITSLEGRSKKAFGITGGISGALGAAVVALIDYFAKPR